MEPHRRELVEDHLPLVDAVVRRIAANLPNHVERADLTAAGRLGLTEAASRYDPSMEVPFAAFAARRIRGAVLDLLRSDDWVPRALRETARRADDISGRLQQRLGRAPDDDELAAALGVSQSDLRASRRAATHGQLTTIDRDREVEGQSIADRLHDGTRSGPEELLEQSELDGYLRAALHHLPERLRFIVIGHYVEGRSIEDLARFLGVTPSRVSQLRASAVDILRQGIDAQFDGGDNDRKPVGRAAQRQANYAAAVARHADWRARLVTRRQQSLPQVLEREGAA